MRTSWIVRGSFAVVAGSLSVATCGCGSESEDAPVPLPRMATRSGSHPRVRLTLPSDEPVPDGTEDLATSAPAAAVEPPTAGGASPVEPPLPPPPRRRALWYRTAPAWARLEPIAPEPLLWLEALDGVGLDEAGRVARWQDRSGLGHDFAQSVVSARPRFVPPPSAFGDVPALDFSGTQHLESADAPDWQFGDFTLFAVVRWKERSQPWWVGPLIAQDDGPMQNPKWMLTWGDGILLHLNDGKGAETSATSEALDPCGEGVLVCVCRRGRVVTFRRNGRLAGTAETDVAVPDVTSPVRIGYGEEDAYCGQMLKAHLAALAAYSSALAPEEIEAVERCLAQTYLLRRTIPAAAPPGDPPPASDAPRDDRTPPAPNPATSTGPDAPRAAPTNP